jgi:hypothetical protein
VAERGYYEKGVLLENNCKNNTTPQQYNNSRKTTNKRNITENMSAYHNGGETWT